MANVFMWDEFHVKVIPKNLFLLESRECGQTNTGILGKGHLKLQNISGICTSPWSLNCPFESIFWLYYNCKQLVPMTTAEIDFISTCAELASHCVSMQKS